MYETTVHLQLVKVYTEKLRIRNSSH